MSTSGTYNFGDTQIDKLITESFERCGIIGDQITGLHINSAKRSLNFMFSEWVNRGLRLWTVQQGMITLNQGQATYALPNGIIDVLEMTRANPTRLNTGGTPFSDAGGIAAYAFDGNPATSCTQTAPNGYISYNYGTGNVNCISYVGIQSNQIIDYTLNIQYSFDNTNWITCLSTGLQSYYTGQIVWYVLPTPVNAQSWRIRETGGSTLDIQELYFDVANLSNLILRISRSDYISYPNKTIQSPPSSFYVDRTITPTLVLWPTPDNTWTNLIFNYMRQIQDVTEMMQNVYAPERFYDAVVAGLAARMAQKFALDRYDMLQSISIDSYNIASNEDQERVPLTIEVSTNSNY